MAIWLEHATEVELQQLQRALPGAPIVSALEWTTDGEPLKMAPGQTYVELPSDDADVRITVD